MGNFLEVIQVPKKLKALENMKIKAFLGQMGL
jgi:hypothetical protein